MVRVGGRLPYLSHSCISRGGERSGGGVRDMRSEEDIGGLMVEYCDLICALYTSL